MTGTILIASAAYVDAELQAEFGRVPPAFLPLGSRRLFVHQAALLAESGARILLSLPEDFSPDLVDARLLQTLGIEIVPVPGGLSLGHSIIYVVNVTASSGGPFRVLHGDTLLRGLDLSVPDAVSVQAEGPPDYRWGSAPGAAWDGAVLTGYFAFSHAPRLVQAVTRAGGDFVAGLTDYAADPGLAQLVAGEWLDFGHVNTYHRSRRRVTTERAFNRLTAEGRAVVKTGRQPQKIEAEARWFEALPAPMRLHAPAYLGRVESADKTAYALEYLHHPTLADLFVFGRLKRATWDRIFSGCDEFLSACATHPAPPGTDTEKNLYLDKTMERLEAHARATGLDLAAPTRLGGVSLPSLERMARIAASAIGTPGAPCLVHGDFCFSNILYDARGDLVRVIDPRGLDAAGAFSVFGDARYDVAKLFHSAVGQYDLIVAGYYDLRVNGPLDFDFFLMPGADREAVAAAFLAHRFAGNTPAEAGAPAIAVLLFLSMLPLHADDPARQSALLANAMRLFQALGTEA